MRLTKALLFVLISLAACGGAPPVNPSTAHVDPHAPRSSTAFDYAGPSWIRVPAKVGDVATHLFFDTGGGITILSDAFCKQMKCVPDGTASGKRMSGQLIEVKMSRVPSIEIAGHRVLNARVAMLDTSSLLHPDMGVDGVAGFDLFRDEAVTIDYGKKELVVEDAASLKARRAAGQTTKIRIENDGPSTVVYLPLTLDAQSKPLEMEVDTGSFDLILDERFMKPLAIDPNAPTTKHNEGKDETDNAYVRYFGKLPHALVVPGITGVSADAGSTVMFQKIIHDGLVGHRFLHSHVVTFDLHDGAMTFAPAKIDEPVR